MSATVEVTSTVAAIATGRAPAAREREHRGPPYRAGDALRRRQDIVVDRCGGRGPSLHGRCGSSLARRRSVAPDRSSSHAHMPCRSSRALGKNSIGRRASELSHIYREAEGPPPPQRVDDNICASQRVAGTVRRPRCSRSRAAGARRSRSPDRAGDLHGRAHGARAASPASTRGPGVPRAGRAAKVSPEPLCDRSAGEIPVQEPRAGRVAEISPAEPRSAAPVTPSPKAAAPLIERNRLRSKPPSRRTPRNGATARLPAIPAWGGILRKTDEPKPSPAAALRQRRASEPRDPGKRPCRMPLAPSTFNRDPAGAGARVCPGPGANTLRESASTLQGAGRCRCPDQLCRRPRRQGAHAGKMARGYSQAQDRGQGDRSRARSGRVQETLPTTSCRRTCASRPESESSGSFKRSSGYSPYTAASPRGAPLPDSSP